MRQLEMVVRGPKQAAELERNRRALQAHCKLLTVVGLLFSALCKFIGLMRESHNLILGNLPHFLILKVEV